jgi:hypothetical protein
MRFQVTFLTAILIFTIFLTGCPSGEPTNTNGTNVNANAPKGNTNAVPANTTKTPEPPTTNNAPTITPVVRAYYDALKKKDDAALKKVMTQEFVQRLESEMKSEGEKSLAIYAASLENLKEQIEVRNEKIEGDTATAELKGGPYKTWTAFEFAKENGEWKYTGKFPDVRKVTETK